MWGRSDSGKKYDNLWPEGISEGFSQIGNYLLVLLYYNSRNSNYSNTLSCLTLVL